MKTDDGKLVSIPLKRIAELRYGLGQPPPEKQNGIPFLRATNVSSGKLLSKDLVLVDPGEVPWRRSPPLVPGDIIVVRSGAYTGDSAIITQEFHGSAAGYDMVVSPVGAEPRFVAWSLLGTPALSEMEERSSRAAQPHLNTAELGEIPIAVVPRSAQTEIADFLDRKAAAIDALIEKKERLIELLAEKRAALIHRAVTKGLNPGVPMKDSGVPWIGEIPAHWEIRPSKFLVDPARPIMYGIVLPGPNVDGGVPIVKANNCRLVDSGSI